MAEGLPAAGADGPMLCEIAYDDVLVGTRLGPFRERVDGVTAGRLRGSLGDFEPVAVAPPAVFPVLFLRALRRAMGGIPAGSVLAKQELELHAELPVDRDVDVTTWISKRYVRRDRPYVVIDFDVRAVDGGASVATGRKVIMWPTGPGQR